MNVINVSQRSDEWRLWRSQGVSASEAAIIMNRSPYKTPWRLWAEKNRPGAGTTAGQQSVDPCRYSTGTRSLATL